ncbi:MAG: hypothetical protein WBB19_03075 [Desulforhopalus sp.]
MKKNIVSQIFIALIFICHGGLLYGEDLSTHSVYKVTSYNLGAIQGFQDKGVSYLSKDSKPLFITGSAVDVLNSEFENMVSEGEVVSQTSSLNSIALSAQIDATEKISIQGAVGVTSNFWTPDLFDSMSGSSWEANLGVIYKLLDNLSYELHFGYMDTGDVFTDRSSYSDVESIIMINNKLSLSF